MFNQGYGVTAGAVCNIFLGHGFYLEPGASLFYDSYSYHNLVIGDEAGITTTTDPSLYKMGLRIPVVVGYTFGIADKVSMSVYTGPEVSYAFAGKVRIDESIDDDFRPDLLFGPDGQRRLDCAWKVGVGVPYNNIFISIDAAIGITDLLKTGMSFRENRVSVAASYYF